MRIVSAAGAGRNQLESGTGTRIEKPKLAAGIKEQVLGVRSPTVEGLVIAFAGCAIPLRDCRSGEGVHLVAAYQHLLRSCRPLYLHQIAVAAKVDQPEAIGTPSQVFRRPGLKTGLVKDLLNGNRLLRESWAGKGEKAGKECNSQNKIRSFQVAAPVRNPAETRMQFRAFRSSLMLQSAATAPIRTGKRYRLQTTHGCST